MVIIYILAIIGGLCVLGIVFLALIIFFEGREDNRQGAEEVELTCALTGEHCIFTAERGTCTGCPVAEEAERIGKSRNTKNAERTAESSKDL